MQSCLYPFLQNQNNASFMIYPTKLWMSDNTSPSVAAGVSIDPTHYYYYYYYYYYYRPDYINRYYVLCVYYFL